MTTNYLPSEWRKAKDRAYNQSMIKFALFVLAVAFFLVPMISHADGGFLNVDIKVYNQQGGNLTDKDMSYEVRYNENGNPNNRFVEVLQGSIQGYNFSENTDLVRFDYQVVPIVPQGYSVKLNDKPTLGCSDTLTSSQMKSVNCTVYYFDDSFYEQLVTSPAPSPVVSPSPQPVTELSVPNTEQLEAQIAQLLQMIDLLRQLIALQSQLNALRGL